MMVILLLATRRGQMNSKRLAIATLSASFLLASVNLPAQAQLLKKLLQGTSQQNEFQTNQFGQPYQSGTGAGFGQNFFGGNQPFSGGQTFSGGQPFFGEISNLAEAQPIFPPT